MNRSKQIGTAWERTVVEYLNANGAPYAERRALAGTLDKGDITGLGPDIVLECKAHKAMDLAGWVDELTVEMRNARASVGAVVHKRRGKNVARAYATLDLETFCRLLAQAGYLEP